MPIYEYHCDDCDKEFETLVLRKSETVVCPDCGGAHLSKMISAHAVGHGMPDTACGSAPCSPAPACGGSMCPGMQ
ncbi:MAG: zinc ribbon domain-containing protein [Mariprofundaceae bacterium]|nr:zinc ribbon domain-containing protein [Mariprofundaceae bacterium]